MIEDLPEWDSPTWGELDDFTGLTVDLTIGPEHFLSVYEPRRLPEDTPRTGVTIPGDLLPPALELRLSVQKTRLRLSDRRQYPARSGLRVPVGPEAQWELIAHRLDKARALNRPSDSIFQGEPVRVWIGGYTAQRVSFGQAFGPVFGLIFERIEFLNLTDD